MSEKENTSNNANRHATWLELFYDLVFVVVIFQLAHNLEEDFSLNGFLGFLALFVPVWWSWTGAVFYATRFGVPAMIRLQKTKTVPTARITTRNRFTVRSSKLKE